MQVITVTSGFIFSNECTFDMLKEIATHKDFAGMSDKAVEQLAKQQLNKASGGKGGKSNGVGDLQYAKLRTVLVNKLQDSQEQGAVFKEGKMQFEFTCLPDLDIGKAGANKQQKTKSNAPAQKGEYVVTGKGKGKCTEDTDAGKWAIWQHIWNSTSFEEYYSKAPKKGVTKTGRVITAASEMGWAIKSGWVAPKQKAE